MSEENVAIIEKAYDALRRQDLFAVLALVAPDVRVWQSEKLPWGGTYEGVDEFKRYAGTLAQHIETTLQPESFTSEGEQTVMVGRTRGRAVTSQQDFDVPVVHVWTVRDGALAGLAVHMDTAAMLDALQQ